MTAEELRRIGETLDARNGVGTHWAGCHLDPRHRDCLAYKLLEEVRRLQRAAADERESCARLVELTVVDFMPDDSPWYVCRELAAALRNGGE